MPSVDQSQRGLHKPLPLLPPHLQPLDSAYRKQHGQAKTLHAAVPKAAVVCSVLFCGLTILATWKRAVREKTYGFVIVMTALGFLEVERKGIPWPEADAVASGFPKQNRILPENHKPAGKRRD